jgi:hypothetical protein
MKSAIGSFFGDDGIWHTIWKDEGKANFCQNDLTVIDGELVKNDKNVAPSVVSAKDCLNAKVFRCF